MSITKAEILAELAKFFSLEVVGQYSENWDNVNQHGWSWQRNVLESDQRNAIINCINHAFDWSKTPQGPKYWEDLYFEWQTHINEW